MFGAATVLSRIFPMCSDFTLAFSLTPEPEYYDKARRIPLVSQPFYDDVSFHYYYLFFFFPFFFSFLLLLLLLLIFIVEFVVGRRKLSMDRLWCGFTSLSSLLLQLLNAHWLQQLSA